MDERGQKISVGWDKREILHGIAGWGGARVKSGGAGKAGQTSSQAC